MIYSLKNKNAIYGKYIKQIKYNSPFDKSMIVDGNNITLLIDYQNYQRFSSVYNYTKINDGKCYYSLVKSYFYVPKQDQDYQTGGFYYYYSDNYYYCYLVPLLVSENKNSVIVKKSYFSSRYGNQDMSTSGYYTFQYKNKIWYCTSFDERNDTGNINKQASRYYYSDYFDEWMNGICVEYNSRKYDIIINSINNSMIYGNPLSVSTDNFSNKLVMIENAKMVIDKYNFKQKYEDQVIPQSWKFNQ